MNEVYDLCTRSLKNGNAKSFRNTKTILGEVSLRPKLSKRSPTSISLLLTDLKLHFSSIESVEMLSRIRMPNLAKMDISSCNLIKVATASTESKTCGKVIGLC